MTRNFNNIMIGCGLAAATLTAAPPEARANWYLSMFEEAADIDHIQLRMADGDQFAEGDALTSFFSSSLDSFSLAFEWEQDFLNDKQNLLVAHGPSLGVDPLASVLYLEGDQEAALSDLPRFHYQTYREGELVSNVDFYVTGPANTDAIILPGTWDQSSPFETYLYDEPAWAFQPGDADLDGDVDIDDLQTWQLNYTGPGSAGASWTEGNWNENLGDGAVDITDLQLWQLNYTGPLTGPPPLHTRDDYAGSLASVPEPASAALIALGVLGLTLRRGRETATR